MENIGELVSDGKAILGIEFGSTRIKAVLINEEHMLIASGDHVWEKKFWELVMPLACSPLILRPRNMI